MAVLQFKFDESYDERFMSIAGWVGEESEWKRLECAWQNHIDRINFCNRPDQQITRFHATTLNCFKEEYTAWTPEMSAAFSSKLIGFIAKRNLFAVCVGIDMHAMRRVFPKGKPGNQDNAYTLCLKLVMSEIGYVMSQLNPDDAVQFIHDKGNWDSQALKSYNLLVDDSRWVHQKRFVGITSMTSSQCVGLQAADMIAYEHHKSLHKNYVYGSTEFRKAISAMNARHIPRIHKLVDEGSIRYLREVLLETGNYPNLDEGGVG